VGIAIKLQGSIAIILSVFFFNYAQAADSEASYAIKGAGSVSCERYSAAVKSGSNEYIAFSGWIDGYVTAFNQYEPETFDIAPWQSTLLLTEALNRHCKKNPEARFFTTFTNMVRALYAQRLKERTAVVKIRSNNGALLMYTGVIMLVQASLNANNGSNLKVDGVFGEGSEKELRRFQSEKKLTVTGLPDQVTLQLLLRK